jgi:transcriptional regulator with XRE-family HTH domain
LPRRQVGRLMRQLREQAGISLMAAANELEFSRARMYRIENGEVAVRKHDVIAMCGIYGATDSIKEVLIGLAAESKAKGWWHAYGDVVPGWFELYVGMESAASRLRHYATGVIPGCSRRRNTPSRSFGRARSSTRRRSRTRWRFGSSGRACSNDVAPSRPSWK